MDKFKIKHFPKYNYGRTKYLRTTAVFIKITEIYHIKWPHVANEFVKTFQKQYVACFSILAFPASRIESMLSINHIMILYICMRALFTFELT